MPTNSRRGILSCTSGALSTSSRDHAPAVATMARMSSVAHRGHGIRAPTPDCRPANSPRGTSSYTWDEPSTSSLQCGSCGDEKGGPNRPTRRRSFMQQRPQQPHRQHGYRSDREVYFCDTTGVSAYSQYYSTGAPFAHCLRHPSRHRAPAMHGRKTLTSPDRAGRRKSDTATHSR